MSLNWTHVCRLQRRGAVHFLYPLVGLLGILWLTNCTRPPITDPEPDAGVEETVQEVDSSAPEEPKVPEPTTEPDNNSTIETLGPAPPIANGVQVRIAHVTDGDTLYLITQVGAWAENSRLVGFNAPECKKKRSGSFYRCNADDEAYGLEAYNVLKKLVDQYKGKKFKLTCKMKGERCEKDTFGRFLVSLQTPDGKDVGEQIILAGAGWSFTRYAFARRADYCRAEAKAIRDKIGLWKNGRAAARSGMNSTTQSWYYSKNKSRSHDSLCSSAMGESFAKAAGE